MRYSRNWFHFCRHWASWLVCCGQKLRPKIRPQLVSLEDRVVPVAPPFAVSMAGNGTQVHFSPLGDSAQLTFASYEPQFVDGSRVAIGDITGDGIPDLVSVAGFHGGPRVVLFDGNTGNILNTYFALEPDFRGGAYVAVGDVNGDKTPDIIVGAGESGGPRVRIFNGKDGTVLEEFFAFDPSARRGVRVTSADVNGDGYADLITTQGIGANAEIRVFSGKDKSKLLVFQAGSATSTGGAYVAAGDVNSDGHADIIVGAGLGDAPQIKVYSGSDASLLNTTDVYESSFLGGVRVAVGGQSDGTATTIWTAAGDGGGPRVRGFNASTMLVTSDQFVFDSNLRGGITVAAGFVANPIAIQVPPTSPPPITIPPTIAPVANDDQITTPFETRVVVPVLANDTASDPTRLKVIAVSSPEHGTAEQVGSEIIYTPNAGFSGVDTFTYTLTDDTGKTSSAIVTVKVVATISAPVVPPCRTAGGSSCTANNSSCSSPSESCSHSG